MADRFRPELFRGAVFGPYDAHQTFRFGERALYCFRRALPRGFRVIGEFRHEYLVHDNVDGVFEILLQFDALAERFFFAVNDHLFESLVQEIVQKLVVLTLASDNDRR